MARPRSDHGSLQHGDPRQEDAATRHLCTGVYLDRAFRRTVLCHVHNDPTRLIPPSYGFRLIPVITHAWRAWLIETVSHTAVLGVLVALLAIHRAALVAVIAVLMLWFTAGRALKHARDTITLLAKEKADVWLRRSRPVSEGHDLRHRQRLTVLYLAGCAIATVTPSLTAGLVGMSPADLWRQAVCLVAVIAVIVAIGAAFFQASLHSVHNGAMAEPRAGSRRISAIAEQQRRPYVIYRRPVSPPEEAEDSVVRIRRFLDDDVSQFVGAGRLVHRWIPPLTVQLLRENGDESEPLEMREWATPPFAAHDLVRRLAAAVRLLADEAEATRLPGLTVRDRLYAAEADMAHRPAWFHKDPSAEDINRIIDDPHGLVQHFLEASVPLRGGELVATIFLRVTVKGRTLSLDFAACALTRTPDAYHALDAHGQSSPTAALRAVLARVLRLPAEVARLGQLAEAPLVLLGALCARTDRMPLPLCGATSIREEKSTPWEEAALDRPIIHDYIKIIEERLLAAAEDFLAAHKVDTSNFRRQAQQIINQGVLNMGQGSVQVNQSAVGLGAQMLDQREIPGNA